MENLSRFKPAFPTKHLLILSGLLWSLVGLMLCRLAFMWYLALNIHDYSINILGGILLAIPIHYFGFSIIAKANIKRIRALPNKPCLFAFMSWWNYPLVAFMISLGLVMRHSPIPKSILGILYIGIGCGLFLSSLHYYKSLMMKTNPFGS
jgi:hypothetical protein